MEQLLNKLIEKGFIPFNIPEITDIKYISTKNKLRITSHQNNRDYKDDFSLRDLVSKSSGLWQFVCENGLLKEEVSICYEGWANVMAEDGCISKHEFGCREIHTNTERGYRLIESALCDEDKLEDFILQNVKIDET